MMRQTMKAVCGGTAVGDRSKRQRPSAWHRRLKLKPLATLLVVVLGPVAVGCLGEKELADSQKPHAIQARIKSGGQTIPVPARSPQPPATVAIIRDNSVNYSSMVSQALEAALGPGGIGNLVQSGTTVLIKPNMVSNHTDWVTDWHLVKALVDQIKSVNGGAAITIADGSAAEDTVAVMTAMGYTSGNIPGVTFADYNDITTNPTDTYVLADSRTGASKQISGLVAEADVYIDMPKMKTHYHAGYTGAVKNVGIGSGPLPLWNLGTGGSAKWNMHHDIRTEIVDHIAARVPDL
ncbi:MAG: DUF362 domain-containing protein, partial [Deltaproteobacteria bacterium]|nr:DUF362 domain-containing protein [Deltaproteobacteria bacterium]